ncbi:hypothetical protein F0160_22540 [Paraburkholderia sp. JPY303]|uniref:hypothetical protein n=1 Tax=Paraburkholderia atlantica TaxID=2654982 RepID=UPI001590102C|nr:hypothetical protein [Paraburkholderia atlantica]NUY33266.1 hypothetical protein [Paraburkholderia atlantica]
MKSLAAALLIVAASTAHAGDILYTPNQANGAIVLTDVQGRCPARTQAYYTTDAFGQVASGGCWVYSNPWVYARNWDGNSHQYLIDNFIVTDYAKAKSQN